MENAILIVGGEPVHNQQWVKALIRDGFSLESAADGIAGLYQAVANRPELVIVDVEDWQTVARMRQVTSAPIIALVGDDGSSGLQSLISGADFYVLKPPPIHELSAKVRAALRHAHSDRLRDL